MIADLVCVAAAFPAFFGMFSKRYSGNAAIGTSIAGIIAGALIFPDPKYATSIIGFIGDALGFQAPNFMRGNLLWSFAFALIVPVLLSIILAKFGKEFDFSLLNEKVNVFDK